MAMPWLTSCLLMGLFSPRPAAGLSCVTDFVNKVSCTWDGSQVGRHVHCWVSGHKKTLRTNGVRRNQIMIRNCTLQPLGGHMRGCSLVFENKSFFSREKMPGIWVLCDGLTVNPRDQLTPYTPCHHIQMNAPTAPNVSIGANKTVISWNPGHPVSKHFENFDFEGQIKHKDQTWQEARTLPSQARELDFPSYRKQPGLHQVRVRVRPIMAEYNATWSDWSPATGWKVETTATNPTPIFRTDHLDVGVAVGGVLITLLAFIAILIARCRRQSKPVPDPSKYFQGFSTLHGKKWLTPYSASDAYFIAQSYDSISPVEVVADPPSTSSSTSSSSTPSGSCESSITAPLLPYSSSTGRTPQDSSSFCYISSVSSSFLSSSSSSSSSSNPSLCISNPSYRHPVDPDRVGPPAAVAGPSINPGHHGDGVLHDGPHLPPTLAAYQSMGADPHGHHRRELRSPDSGISIGGPKYPADPGMDKGWEGGEEELASEEKEEDEGGDSSWEHGLTRVFLMASRISSAAAPSYMATQCWPPLPSPVGDGGDDYDDDVYEYEDSGGTRLPVGGTMGRASSMPVEPPCNRGYHTANDLQATYSSKSI